jgi:hypothetical protein
LCFYDRNKRVPVGLIDGLSQDWSVVDKDDIVQQYEVCILLFFLKTSLINAISFL